MKFEIKMTIEVDQAEIIRYMLLRGVFDSEAEAVEHEINMHMINSEELSLDAVTVTVTECKAIKE